jgi:hypothetical protein
VAVTIGELYGSSGLDDKEVTVRNLPKNLGMLLLAVWLILTGLIEVLKFSFSGLPLIMALLAIVAGALILLQRT